jgi:hypothetical protein
MNENGKAELGLISCPLMNEIVRVEKSCRLCPQWNGVRCGLITERRTGRFRGILQGFLKTVEMARRLGRKGGRGLRVPLVWEKWPQAGARGETPGEPPGVSEESEYGLARLLSENPDLVQRRKKEDEEDFDSPLPVLRSIKKPPVGPEVEVEKFDPASEQWPELEPLPEFRPHNPQDEALPQLPGADFQGSDLPGEETGIQGFGWPPKPPGPPERTE